MRRHLLTAALAASLAMPATAAGARKQRCNTQACAERVRHRAERREMRRYRHHPLPWCTWGPESGVGLPAYSMRRYRALNQSSVAGGKFQMLPSTFHAFGGQGFPHLARPVVQERIARRVLRGQGLSAWVGC